MNQELIVYSKPGCGGCNFTKKYLQKSNIEYKEINVIENEEGLKRIKEFGHSSLPVVEFNGKLFSGHQPQELDKIILSIKGA